MDSPSNLTSLSEETHEEEEEEQQHHHQSKASSVSSSAYSSIPNRPPIQASSQKYSPIHAMGYFDQEDDIHIPDSNDVFHLYKAGSDGPVVFCLHGGGYCGLSFALAASKIKEKARVVAMDLRGHGKSSTENELNISIEIEWSVRGGSLRNIESARVSIPGTLKYDDSKNCYIYRTQLEEMEQYWRGCCYYSYGQASTGAAEWGGQVWVAGEEGEGWNGSGDVRKGGSRYEGLSEKFLSCPAPKLLLLAGTDRLDRALTIGQMQGKFQMVVVRHTGHAIQEDVPDEFANLILNFISRNRIGPRGIEIPGIRRPSQFQP